MVLGARGWRNVATALVVVTKKDAFEAMHDENDDKAIPEKKLLCAQTLLLCKYGDFSTH